MNRRTPEAAVENKIPNPMRALRARLAAVGVNRSFLNQVVLPSWWRDEIASEPAGLREAAGYIFAHMGFSISDLLRTEGALPLPSPAGVRYKKARDVSHDDVKLATTVALGLARAAAQAYPDTAVGSIPPPEAWRNQLLNAGPDRAWIELNHVVDGAWRLGIPVLHLRNLPAKAKKPDALTTRIGDRPVIVVMSERKSPSWQAFIVAHELGHIHAGHVKPGQTLVDGSVADQGSDADEQAANDFACRLLTGAPDLGLHSARRPTAVQLAGQVREFGRKNRIAPGVAALNFGFNTRFWPVANGALSELEAGQDARNVLDAALARHLPTGELSEEKREWIARATHREA